MDAPLQHVLSPQWTPSVSVSREWTPLYSLMSVLFTRETVSVSREWTPLYSMEFSRTMTSTVSVSREWTPLYSPAFRGSPSLPVSVSREWTPLYSRGGRLGGEVLGFRSAVNGRPSTAFLPTTMCQCCVSVSREWTPLYSLTGPNPLTGNRIAALEALENTTREP